MRPLLLLLAACALALGLAAAASVLFPSLLFSSVLFSSQDIVSPDMVPVEPCPTLTRAPSTPPQLLEPLRKRVKVGASVQHAPFLCEVWVPWYIVFYSHVRKIGRDPLPSPCIDRATVDWSVGHALRWRRSTPQCLAGCAARGGTLDSRPATPAAKYCTRQGQSCGGTSNFHVFKLLELI